MASPFKIPKRKLTSDPVSDCLLMQSPLSRLQTGTGPFEKNWAESTRGRADRMHSGNGLGSRAERESVPLKPLFQDTVKSLLGLSQPTKGSSDMSAANQRPGSKWNNQSKSGTPTRQPGQRPPESSPSGLSNRWRPRRASDKLFGPMEKQQCLSPPEKKRSSTGLSDSVLSVRSSSVDLVDSDVPGSLSTSSLAETRWRPAESRRNTAELDSSQKRRPPEALQNHTNNNCSSGTSTSGTSDQTSEDDLISRTRTPGDKTLSEDAQEHSRYFASSSSSSSSSSTSSTSLVPRKRSERRLSLNRTSWLAASHNLVSLQREERRKERERDAERQRERERDAERQRERERDTERRREREPSSSHRPRLRRAKPTPSEPIVLSSEEEEGEEDEGEAEKRLSEGSSRVKASPGDQTQGDQAGEVIPGSRVGEGVRARGPDQSPPPVMELGFTALHTGLTCSSSHGTMMIMECGITLPLKGSEVGGAEEGVVTLVASQVRGYGLWDGGVAQGGALLRDWEGPAPSLLFLWVTDAQANLLQTELMAIHPVTEPGQSCTVLLLVLREQLGEVQAALLASVLDMEEYRLGRSTELLSPLDWAQGLALLHTLPPPLDTHLLELLGHTAGREEERPSQTQTSLRNRKSRLHSSSLQGLPNRLIQYPAAPCKGRITVTTEDVACLNIGEFLNDVIIDFYLKYLLLERAGSVVAERCHVLSSFFYKQLSRRRAAGEEEAPSIPDRDMRHQRVKTWTRHVDIFNKDFLFVPVNQEAHWYLVVICFPGLEEARYEAWQSPATAEDDGVKGKLQSQAEGPSLEAKRVRGAPGSSSSSQASAGGPDRTVSLRSHRTPPACTQEGWQRHTVLKRPCILVMDSLKLSYHENVCRLLRDYLHVEWEVRRGTPRLFTADSMRSSTCRVPLQDNSSDCGLYLLQYVESFLQNPVVHFDLPLGLEHWFPRQQVWRKREEIRSLVLQMHRSQHNSDVIKR